jgi:hypothetical protein
MKRSSERRARRWVLEELTRCIDRHRDLTSDSGPEAVSDSPRGSTTS